MRQCLHLFVAAIAIAPAAPALSAEKSSTKRTEQTRDRLEKRGFRCRRPLRLGRVQANAATIPRYGKFELTFALEGTFDNPFDPDQIDVVAEIRAPSGKEIRLPAFFFQDFERTRNAPPKCIGKPAWKLRFTPTEPGRYTYRLVARNAGAKTSTQEAAFTCTPRKHRGAVRVSKATPLACEFENGAPYVPRGINLFQFARLGRPYPPQRLETCERWMNKLADGGGNFIRLRMDSWWLAIEMPPDKACGYLGLGYYHQPTAWIIDKIYDLAAERGLYVMHCLDNANANVNLRPEARRNKRLAWRFAYDVYAKENGGVCDRNIDIWSNPEARRQWRNKIRYVIARWGWSPNVMCWEFHNETAVRPDMIEAAVRWHREMGRYLRGLDPCNRPVTTSLMGNHELAHRIWALPEIDIIQYHFYSRDAMAPQIMALTREGLDDHGKPFFLGEYGVQPQFDPGNATYDRIGIHMHNGMWAALFARGCGAGAMWYIGNYVEPFDLWRHYRSLGQFADRMPWNAPELKAFAVAPPKFDHLPAKLHFRDLTLPTSNKYAFARAPQQHFTIHADGSMTPADMLPPNLNTSRERKTTPIFHLDLDQPAKFVVRVGRSVGDKTNRLLVTLDDRNVIDAPFPAGKQYNAESEYIARYANWRTPYDKEIEITVPAGKHTVRCEAVGKDRLEVRYGLKNGVAIEKQHPLRAYGFRTDRAVFLWFWNSTASWRTAWEKQEPLPLTGMTTTIEGLPDGTCRIEWYDTWKGRVVKTEKRPCRAGTLTLSIPAVLRDIACIVQGP